MLRIKKIGLLPRVALAIALGILCAFWMPSSLSRVFATFNELFGNFLGFAIPLIVFGLVASGIAELGTGSGRLLGITTLLAYGSTLLAGFFAYFVCLWCYPPILGSEASLGSLETAGVSRLVPYFTVETSALLLSFVLGLGTARGGGNTLKKGLSEFRDVIGRIIERAIVPLLPLYIFGIFLKMGAEGQVAGILSLFLKIIALIFAMHLLLLLFQYGLAGIVSRRNPLKLLRTMLPAYMTALGTQSSAATIPVTLERTIRNGVNPELAGFVIPLNATIHLSGSILKIVACALAIMWMTGMPIHTGQYAGFIAMLVMALVGLVTIYDRPLHRHGQVRDGRQRHRGRRDRADRRPHLPQAQTARCRTGRPNGQRRITGQTALSATTRSSRLVRAAPSHPIGPRSLPSGDLDFAFPTPPRQYPGPDARRRRARKIPPTDGFPTPDEENPPKIRILSSTNPNRFL